MRTTLTLRYLLVIAILTIPFQGVMASGCELPSSDNQAVSSSNSDHGSNHAQAQKPAAEDTDIHSCCDETTCSEMDGFCGSCINLVTLVSETLLISSTKGPEHHRATTTTLIDLAPPPPTKPPV